MLPNSFPIYPAKYLGLSKSPLGSLSSVPGINGVVQTLYGLNVVTELLRKSAELDIAHHPPPEFTLLYHAAF